MKARITVCAALALVASGLRADPYVGYAAPSSLQVGTTNQVIVGGQRLWGLRYGWVSGTGVEVIGIEKVPPFPVANGQGQRAWLEKWMYGIRAGNREMPSLKNVKDAHLIGWTRCKWWETLDQLDPLRFSLAAEGLFVRKNPLQASPSLSERAIVKIAVSPKAEPGVRWLILVDGQGATAPRPLLITAERHVAEPFYQLPLRRNEKKLDLPREIVRPPVVIDGQVMPGETDTFDLNLTEGERTIFELTGREFTPYLGDAVPGFFNPVMCLKDDDGKVVAFADDYGSLPDPVFAYTPERSGVYHLEVRDNLYRGRADFVYAVRVTIGDDDLPRLAEKAFATYPSVNSEGAAKAGQQKISGNLPCALATREHDFRVDEPGLWTFELVARRNGSPLDGVMRLYGPLAGMLRKTGPLLKTWDDVTNAVYVGSVPQAECDPIGHWQFAEPGTYRITIEDRNGAGGPGFDYTLKMGPSRPVLEAYANKSAFVLPAGGGGRFSFKLRLVRRNGFAGKVRLDGGETFRLRPDEVAADQNEVQVTAEAPGPAWEGMRSFTLTAIGEVAGGHNLVVPIVPTDEEEQAFAYTHLLPAGEFRVYRAPFQSQRAAAPTWPEMPYDHFLPRRVLRSHDELSKYRTAYAQALDALAKVDVPIVEVPANAGDAVLATKFASSAAVVRQRPVETLAYEPSRGAANSRAAAWAVLGGVNRFVSRDLRYAEGDAQRVRILARAKPDHVDSDVLLYVPSGMDNPLSGQVGRLARRLRDAGWSFDFVTEPMVNRIPFGRYHAVVLPDGPIPESVAQTFATATKQRGFTVVRANELGGKGKQNPLAKRCRRDQMPKGLRFVRYGQGWGEGWYFVHNPSSVTISGTCRFAIRGQARTAYAMHVGTGIIERLRATQDKEKGRQPFALALGSGESVWIWVSVKEAAE